MEILNRKAHFNYTIEDEVEAGLVLVGSEVKSLRQGKASIAEGYVAEIKGELFLLNCNITEYKGANKFNHEPTRPRKILLKKKEIAKIVGKMEQKGYSIVPLKLYFKKNYAKVLLGLGKGKKLYDKRDSIKKRDESRRVAREGE